MLTLNPPPLPLPPFPGPGSRGFLFRGGGEGGWDQQHPRRPPASQLRTGQSANES